MCSICDVRIEFGAVHPMGLSVAVATRRAIEERLVPEAASAWDRDGAIELMRGVQERLERVFEPEALRALPAFFVLLIETRTWAYFSPGVRGFDSAARRAPPDDFARDAEAGGRDATLLAAETSLAPMLQGRLPFEKVEGQGMLLIDAIPSERAALRAAWARAWPAFGFSRFVCS